MSASLVQKLGTTSGAAPKTVTIPASGVPIGDLVVVFVASDSASDPTTVTDTGGNTYTKAISSQIQTGAGLWFSRLTVALVSGNTVSVNGYAGASAIGASQFTGILTSPQDKTQSANAASGTALASGTTTATAQADELHVACWGLNINNSSSTPGGTFNILDTLASATVSLVSEYRILTSTGTQTATATGGATAAWDGVQATFKATAAAASGGPMLARITNRLVGPQALRYLFRQTVFMSEPMSQPTAVVLPPLPVVVDTAVSQAANN